MKPFRAVRRHPHIAIIAAVSALALTLTSGWVLLTPAHHDTRETLLPLEPSVSPTADATTSPTSTPEPSPTVTVDVAPPTGEASPAATSSPAPTSLHVDADHLLSDTYVDSAFGRGPFIGNWTGDGAPLACLALLQKDWDRIIPVSRNWSWPGERVVGETLARAPTVGQASSLFDMCMRRTDGFGKRAPAGTPQDLHLGDDSFLWSGSDNLYGEAQAGVRFGRDLVLLVWRQSGPLGDDAALAAAARAALAAAEGGNETRALAAPTQQPPAAMHGFPSYDDLRPIMNSAGRAWDGMTWQNDAPGFERIRCSTADAQNQVSIPTSGPSVIRNLLGGVLNAMDATEVSVTLAAAADEAIAVSDFDTCRKSLAGAQPVPDLGDEAFAAQTEWTLDGNEQSVFVRVGAHYVVLRAFNEEHEVEMTRATFALLTTAGRLS